MPTRPRTLRRRKRKTNKYGGTYRSKKRTKKVLFPRSVPRPISLGFPKTQTVKMRYAAVVSLTPTSAGPAGYIFRANAAFDPDYTSTGHQPRTFDQWSLMYKKYCVTGSKITARPYGPTTWEDVTSIIYGIAKKADASLPSPMGFIDVAEQPQLLGDYCYMDPSVQRSKTASRTFSLKKDLAQDPASGNSGLMGNTGTGSVPSEEMYFILWCLTPAGVAGQEIQFNVVIDMTVKLTEQKPLAAS